MRLYKEVEENSYSWTLFFLLNDLPWDATKDKYEEKDLGGGLFVKTRLSAGFGLSKKEEMDKLGNCRFLKVYTDEVELSIMTNDKYLYKYEPVREGELPVKGLDIIGAYVYITNEEIASPVFVKSGGYVNSPFFKNFREYTLMNKTKAGCFTIEYFPEENRFLVSSDHIGDDDNAENTDILEITNIGKGTTYGFVYYILSSICIDDSIILAEDYKVKKIEKVWSGAS